MLPPPMAWKGCIPGNHGKSWKNWFFINCCRVSWLCSYMSRITPKVYLNALGPISMLLVQSGKIRYFDLWEHEIPQGHGFYEKSWKNWFFGNQSKVSRECSYVPKMVCKVFFAALKFFTCISQTNGGPLQVPCNSRPVRSYVLNHLPSSILLKFCTELELICPGLQKKF